MAHSWKGEMELGAEKQPRAIRHPMQAPATVGKVAAWREIESCGRKEESRDGLYSGG